jgi:hypothetical protein
VSILWDGSEKNLRGHGADLGKGFVVGKRFYLAEAMK